MNEAAPIKKESLRGTETLSPELALMLREAVQKFSTAYKIRQAAGYDYKPSNAVDGNFALRMQYGQLREEIKRLGRHLDAGETLEEDDYRALVKKQAAFDRSYEKVLQYAADNNIDIDVLSEAGEESITQAVNNATIESNMETTKQSVATTPEYTPPTKPQLEADMYESDSLGNTPEQSAATNSAARNRNEERMDPVLSPELKQALLNKLTEYETRVEAFRKTLTDKAVESHASYDDFKNKSHKLRALLASDRTEVADAVVKQQVESLQPRLDAMHQEITTDLQKQREDFETWVGPELAELRDSTDLEPDDSSKYATKDKTTKKTGWFDPAFRRARGVDTAANSNNKPDTTEPFIATEAMRVDTDTSSTEPFVLTEEMRVHDEADATTEPTESAVGDYPTDPSAIPEFKQDWQQVQEEAPVSNNTEDNPSEVAASEIGNYPDSQDKVPEFAQPWQSVAAEMQSETSVGESLESTAEKPATIMGQELPPSGSVGAAATDNLKQALSKMLLIQDAKMPGREKKAVHQAWGILHAVSPEQGMSTEQRQQLAELANDLPQTSPETALAEVRAWQELNQRLPDLSEKLNRADEVTKSGWRRRGKQVLLAAAVVFGSATPTADEDPGNSRSQSSGLDIAVAAPSTPDVDTAETTHELPTEQFGQYQATPVNSAIDSITGRTSTEQNMQRTAPVAPTQGPGRSYEQSHLDTDDFGKGTENIDEAGPTIIDMASDQRSVAFETPTESAAPKAPEADTLPDLSNLLTFFERPVLSHTFTEGSSIDTVSEAVWEAWKTHANTQAIESPLSKSEFINAMYRVIRGIEKNPEIHRTLTDQMHISSGNIHRVQVGETINLAPFLAKVRANANAVFV